MQVSLRDRLRAAVRAAMRAAKWENDVTVLFSRRVSLRAEPESQSEARKMSRDSRGWG